MKMDNKESKLIGRYYVQLKDVHINWGHRAGREKSNEAYLPIPSKYAYAFNILRGNEYACTLQDTNNTIRLLAAGSQGRNGYAKQFHGAHDLSILYDWYASHNAMAGDFVVVTIFCQKEMTLEFISQSQADRIKDLNLVHSSGKPFNAAESSRAATSGFRLVSLLVRNKEQIVYDYRFLPEELIKGNTEPLSSLIIGANGTGKSFAMKILSEIFLSVQNNLVRRALSYDYYYLKYYIDGKCVEVEIANRSLILHMNGVRFEKPNEAALPAKVLAIAFMLNDKFAFKAQDPEQKSTYEYLGMRKTSNAAWTSSFDNRVAENLLELAACGKLWGILRELSSYMNIDPMISFSYELSERELDINEIKNRSIASLADQLKNIGSKIIESSDYRSSAVKKLHNEDYYELACFLRGLVDFDPFIHDNNKKIFGHTFNVDTSLENIQKIQADYGLLHELSNLLIIKNITLYLYKDGHKYSFEDSSSGEKHILYAFLNIARHIQENSLILIDEPEISLHPNWQMMYISYMKRLFKEYSSCHFIIASHSPYLVSDLNPDSSALIVLNMDNGTRSCQTVDYSTYAWSTENILYNVFHVRTTRNFYFDMELRELLSLTTNKAENQLARIRQLYSKLSSYIFDKNDPLNLILREVKEYIENVESDQSS